jgi:hypothetical protein
MSVNIFGSSGGGRLSSNVDKKYVDQKFATLSTNLATKVNKSGDAMSGNLEMGGNKISNVAEPTHNLDVVSKQNVDEKFLTLSNNLATKVNKSGDTLQGDLNMAGYKICNVKDPVNGSDAVNKRCLDKLFIENSVGFIPNLTSNNRNKSGYNVTASSELKDHQAFCAFNSSKQLGWAVADGITANFWIEITCPEPILIYRCIIRGRLTNGARIDSWKLQGNIGDGFHTWVDLFIAPNISVDSTLYTFYVTPSAKYAQYRIFVVNAESINPGLSHWQLYAVDQIISL